jgi:predicted membrane chloride channel (bestrophin family)
MITYESDFFGFKILLQVHGSAVYRAVVPALLSTLLLVVVASAWPNSHWYSNDNENDQGQTLHPYTITIYVNAFSLLLTFRLNFSYQRYWEAASQLFLMMSKWSDAATCLAAFHYQQEALYEHRHLPPFGEVEEAPPPPADDDDEENQEEEEEEKKNDSNNDGRPHLRRSRHQHPVHHVSRDLPPDYIPPPPTAAGGGAAVSAAAAGGGGGGRERDDSSGPFILKRWLNSAQGRRRRRGLRLSRQSKEKQPEEAASGNAEAHANEERHDQSQHATSTSTSRQSVSFDESTPQQQQQQKEGNDQTKFDGQSLTSSPTSTSRPGRISTLASVMEGIPAVFSSMAASISNNDSPAFQHSPPQARRQTMPATYSPQQPQQTEQQDAQQVDRDRTYRHSNSADGLDTRKQKSKTRKSSRKSQMIQRHDFQQPQFGSMTSVTDDIGGSNISRPQGMHRRVPSADVPQPYETIRSFQNRPSLAFEQKNYAHLLQSGLHRRSNLGNASKTSSQSERGHNTAAVSALYSPTNVDGRRGGGHRGSAAVTFTGIGATPLPGIGGSGFGAKRYNATEGLAGIDYETGTIRTRRRRSSFQVPINEEENTNISGGVTRQYQQQRRRSTPLPSFSRNSGQVSHIDASSIADIVSNSTVGRAISGEETTATGSGRTSPSTAGGDGFGDDNSHANFDATRSSTKNTRDEDESSGPPAPSLFLQEAAHLFSLTSAVAMASLRADMEGVASPLVEYVPGLEFPAVNPDQIQNTTIVVVDEDSTSNDGDGGELTSSNTGDRAPRMSNTTGGSETQSQPQKTKKQFQQIQIQPHFLSNNGFWRAVYFLLGLSRSPRQRTLYNATRPFTVLGGISDHEVYMLQQARGPEAQIALCGLWVKEFISREYLSGSTGAVGPPIIARIYQFFSDGTTQYHQCRKIAYIQFPFPQAQLTIFFLFVSLVMFPYLYYSYVNSPTMACILNFMTVVCFVGQQEVARELQDPFYQYPNDLPLNNYQAQFNEALISSLFTGFHPDFTNHDDDDDSDGSLGEDEDEFKEGTTHEIRMANEKSAGMSSAQRDEFELTSDEMTLISKAAGKSPGVQPPGTKRE